MARSLLGLKSPAATSWRIWPMTRTRCWIISHRACHIVGASMGGMIAQVFAARHSHRTRSLGGHLLQQQPSPAPAARAETAAGAAAEAHGLLPGSRHREHDPADRDHRQPPRFPTPRDKARADAIESYDRSYYPAGVGRQFAAIMGSGSLRHYNRQVTVPTVVIHGKADKLMRPSGGRAIARAIPGARLVLFDGMAHDLPEACGMTSSANSNRISPADPVGSGRSRSSYR